MNLYILILGKDNRQILGIMNSDDLISRFAMEPYIIPVPQEKTVNYDPKNTLDTLFDLEQKSDIIKSNQELMQKLELLEQNIPQIYNLQSDKLSQPIPNDIDQNSISVFISKLADPAIHPYQLCPVPNIEIMPLKELLEHCIENRIAPDRAAWAVHFYIKKCANSYDLTDAFKSAFIPDKSKASSLQPFNYSHLSKFAYELYTRNLLRHEDIILSLMDFLPSSFMSIFKNEILPTYSILFQFLTKSKYRNDYKLLFSNELQQIRSQLVQLGLNPLSSEIVKDLQNDETEKRIKYLNDALSYSRLSYSTHYRNLIFQSFPFIDANIIEENMSSKLKYSTDKEKQELAMTMCHSVLWFSCKREAVSATVAALIKRLVPKFKYRKFFNFLFKNPSIVENYRYLFIEFQLQKIFDYKDFLYYVKIKGLLTRHREEAAEIIPNLPSLNRTKNVMNQIFYIINDLFPGNDFDQQISSLNSDLINHVDQINNLPYIFVVNIILFLINQNKYDFGQLCSVLQKIDALSLITVLFEINKPSKFTVFDYSFIEKTVPCFIAHNLLASFASTALTPENPNDKISELLARFLKECKDYKVASCLSKYEAQLPSRNKSTKVLNISTTNLQTFIINNSHLCSLYIYDLFFSVKQENDFRKVFCQLLNDLLGFPILTDDMLFGFFVNFCESHSISRGTDQFIKCFMQTIINDQKLVEDEDSNSRRVITNFLTLLFKNGFINPSSYLRIILPSRNKSNGNANEHLINLFFKIIEDNPNSFPVESILSENVISNLNDPGLYKHLLQLLRNFTSPIITESLRSSLTKEGPSAISAAYYSLLPLGLQAQDFKDVFDFYAKNVDRTTSTFWTLWLRYKIFYNSGFPVTPYQPDKQQIQDHISKLWSCFYNLILVEHYDTNNPESNEKLQIYLNCWTLLCMDPEDQFTKFVSLKTATSIKIDKPLINPLQIEYLHPVINNCQEAYLEQICDGFCKYQFPNDDSDHDLSNDNIILMRIASYTFVTFANRFMKARMQSTAIVKSMADKLLVWLLSITNDKYRQTDTYILDSFNYIVTKTTEMEPEQNRAFHEHILESLEQFPSSFREYILVNFLMQSFSKVQDPLYYNFTVPHQDPIGGPFFGDESLPSFDMAFTNYNETDNLDNWF